MAKANRRADHIGPHRTEYERNRQKILATQDVCGICGRPVDKTLKYPDPLAPCVDHIIPIALGGHPSDIRNLQLAHWKCNSIKGKKLRREASADMDREIDNNDLPQSMDWTKYRPGQF